MMNLTVEHEHRVLGWRSGESTRLSPLWSGFDYLTWRHKWVVFVVSSRPFAEGFSPGSPVFLPPQKPTLQIPIRSALSSRHDKMRVTNIKYLFILFILFMTLLKGQVRGTT